MIDPQELLGRFNTEEFPPVLDEEARDVIMGFFKSNNMELTRGYSPTPNFPLTTKKIVAACLFDAPGSPRELNKGSLVGPYIVEDLYKPMGVGIWEQVRDTVS